jgi:hypothetical protein
LEEYKRSIKLILTLPALHMRFKEWINVLWLTDFKENRYLMVHLIR